VPSKIPTEIIFDRTELGLEQSVLASELELPEGVTPAFKVDYAVARIMVPRALKAAQRAAAVEEKG
jgi:hypothetical protein